jgi:hypothetical protein
MVAGGTNGGNVPEDLAFDGVGLILMVVWIPET